MTEERWSDVDTYLCEAVLPPDAALGAALADARSAGLPAIDVAPNQGMLLHILARSIGARRVLEIGTLGGYSTIWLARAVPADGQVVTLEIEPRHAEVAAANLERAGVRAVVDIRVGRAVDTLPGLLDEGGEPFDLVFIDADKPSNPEYLEWALRLTRPGSLIVVDNVVRNGSVADAGSTDPNVVGSRRVLDRMGADRRLVATALQTVGSKGHDGLAIGLVVDR